MFPRPRRRPTVHLECPSTEGRPVVPVPRRAVDVHPVARDGAVTLAAGWDCPACHGVHTRDLDVLDVVVLAAAGVSASLEVHMGPQDAPEQVLAALAGIRSAIPAGADRMRRSEAFVFRGMHGAQ